MEDTTKQQENVQQQNVCSFCGKVIKATDNSAVGNDGVFICQDCVSNIFEMMNAMPTEIDKLEKIKAMESPQKVTLPHPSEIKAHLDQYIEGQEYAKRVLSVAVYNHYKMLQIKAGQSVEEKLGGVDLEKSNVLLVGPSGCGKTAILKALAKYLKVPFTMADITAYSSSGYVGKDVETIIRDLVSAANGDVKAAERGIVYIDEIDKTSRKGENLSTTADPGHEGVQQALLKLLEGSTIEIPDKGRRIHPEAMNTTIVNTENILFIVGGAFEGIEKIVAKRVRKHISTMGFGSKVVDKNNDKYNDFILDVTTEDLKKFGMLPEILGRVPIISPMQELTEDQLVNILYRPKNALVKQYQELFKHDDMTLHYTPEALKAIAKKAIERKTGARGLRGIMEDILNPVMYAAPDREENAVCIMTDPDNDAEVKVEYFFEKDVDKKEEAVING